MPDLKEARLQPLFAVPFLRHRWADSAALNEELRRLILAQEARSAGQVKSNVGGWQSTEDIQTWTGEAGRLLIGRMIELVNHATGLLLGEHRIQQRFDWNLAAWANVNRRGQYNKPHLHPASTWSGTYYVDAGDPAPEGNELSGLLSLMHPNPAAPMSFFRMLPQAINVQPADGLMVLFPSYLPHIVYPYDGERPRISVAFNVQRVPYP